MAAGLRPRRHGNGTDSRGCGPGGSTGSLVSASRHTPGTTFRHQENVTLTARRTRVVTCYDLAGEAVRVKGQLPGPHDQSGGWDWLEASRTPAASEHPEARGRSQRKWRQRRSPGGGKEARGALTCSSPAGSRCSPPSRTARRASAARSGTGCSAGRRRATRRPRPIGRSGRTPARRSRRTSSAPGGTRPRESGTDLGSFHVSFTGQKDRGMLHRT